MTTSFPPTLFAKGLMTKKFIFLILFSFCLAFSLQSVSAWSFFTHYNITTEALNEEPDGNLIKEAIMKNADTLDACHVGINFPDVTVIYYYTSFEDYAALHDWNVYYKLLELAKTDRERAFAYCYGTHLAMDSISHNYFIPDKIRRTKLPNEIIHPVQEVALDAKYYSVEALGSFKGWAEFIPIMKEATGRDWSAEAKILESAISGGHFEDAFSPPDTGFVNKFYSWLSSVLRRFVDVNPSLPYVDLSKKEIREILSGGTSTLDPAGYAQLKAANSSINMWKYLIAAIIFIILYLLLRRFRWV